MDCSEIVKKYLIARSTRPNRQRLSLRLFVKELCDGIPGKGVTFSAVGSWSTGLYKPDPEWLYKLLGSTSVYDWRHDFAMELLTAEGRDDLIRLSRNNVSLALKDLTEAYISAVQHV